MYSTMCRERHVEWEEGGGLRLYITTKSHTLCQQLVHCSWVLTDGIEPDSKHQLYRNMSKLHLKIKAT